MASQEFILVNICFSAVILGVIVSFLFHFYNINPFKFSKEASRTKPAHAYDEQYEMHEVEPAKVVLLRVPETGFETQVTSFAFFWNGQVAMFNGDDFVYAVDDKRYLQPDDELSLLRGDDIYVINVESKGHKAKMADRLRLMEFENAILKGQVKDANASTKEQLLKFGELTKEARKSIGWSSGGYSGGYQFRKPWFGSSGGSQYDDEEPL